MTQDNRYNVIDETLARVPNPAGDALPPVSRDQAARVLAALERKFFVPMGKTLPSWCRDVRRVWIAKQPTHPGNHDKGLGRLVHDVSHALFARVYPDRRLHDPLHVKYEHDVAEYVATSKRVRAILTPRPKKAPKAEPTRDELRRLKIARNEAALERWHAKMRRAQRAIAKLKRSQRGLLRHV